MTCALENMYGLLASLPTSHEGTYFVTRRLDLITSSVNVTVRGYVAHLSIDLKYLNTHNQTVEVTYTCPVDAKSAIFEFRAELNGRTIHAHCVEKTKAKTLYKDAVSKGHAAVIATEAAESADLLQLSLGNLHKDEFALLHLEMVMELPVGTDGSVNFTCPTVFNPRYSPSLHHDTSSSSSDDESSLEKGVGPPKPVVATADPKNPELYMTDVKAKVVGTFRIDRISSSASTFDTILNENATEAELTKFLVHKEDKDWGFRVYYHSAHQPHVLKETGERSSTGMMADDVIMLNLFPEIPMDAFSPHNEIIFVVDCSGSMEGNKILRAKTTLLLFLKSIPQGCRFNIICFGSDFKQLFEESCSERYTEETLKKAVDFQRKIKADLGGTEIFSPLKHIYSKKPTAGYARQILIITDGEVWNVNELMELVARNSVDTRLFSVGIGAGASTALVQGLARAGKGRHEMIDDAGQLQITVMGLIASMLQNNVVDVQVNIELDPPHNVSLIPSTPPVIFGGQHLILYARVPPQSNVKKLCVTGNVGDKAVTYEVKEEDCKQIHDTKLSLHRIAAKKQIAEWQLKKDDNNEDQISLSISSGVVCRLTALVGIDQDGQSYREAQNSWKKRSEPKERYIGMNYCSRSFDPSDESDDEGDVDTCWGLSENIDSLLAAPSQRAGHAQMYSSPATQKNIESLFSKSKSRKKKKKKRASTCAVLPPMSQNMYSSRAVYDVKMMKRKTCEVSVVIDEAKMKQEDSLFDAILKQNFDGSWNQEIFSILNMSVQKMELLNNIKKEFNLDDLSFTTVVCLTWFRTDHLKRKLEWDLISIKGSMFLQSKGLDSSQLVDKCVALLSPAN